jgi:alkaline phosphatase
MKVVDEYSQGKLTLRSVIRVISPIINKYVGVIFASTEHTAEPVPIFAKGTNAELVKNIRDNTDVFHLILTAYLGKPNTPLTTWSIIRVITSYK